MTTEFTFDTDLVSDLHKDAFGFRPREGFWMRWNIMNDVEKQNEWNYLLQTARDEAEADERRQDQAEAAAITEIALYRSMLGSDSTVADAVRALHDAYHTDGDDGFLEYKLGTRYGFIAKKLAMHGEVARG